MKKHDLRAAVPRTITLLRDRGEPVTVNQVLKVLGVESPPTLPRSAARARGVVAQRPAPADATGLLSLGRFQLVSEIGRGGMGRIMEARDPELRRSVAVKMVIDPTEVSSAQLARFVAEAQITSQLEHPNIVPVYDVGLSEDGQLYFVMKKVEGRSLREVVSALGEGDEATTAEFPHTKLLHAFIQVCHAAAYAHDRGCCTAT